MNVSRRQFVLFLGDIILVAAAIYLSHVVRYPLMGEDYQPLQKILSVFTGATGLAILVHTVLFYVFELYEIGFPWRTLRGFFRVLLATGLASIVLSFFYFFIPFWKFGRGIVAIHPFFIVLLIYLWRVAYSLATRSLEAGRRLLIVGAGPAGQSLAAAVRAKPESGLRVIGFLDQNETATGAADEPPVIGLPTEAPRIAEDTRADMIVVAVTESLDSDVVSTLLSCKARGIRLNDMPTLYKSVTGRIPVLHTAGTWFLFGPGFDLAARPLSRNIQRLIDLGVSIAGLILSAPLLVLGATAIKLTSRGPVFFRQERLGLNEAPYWLVKLRTMRQDAEKNGAQWATQNDPRTTFVGRILRRTRLDEIPQFWNILKGEMSIIGPRPERDEFVRELKKEIPYYSLRFSTKPGLTGWAQVNYRYGSSKEDALEKLQYELYYIQERSLFLDLQILLKTVQTVLLRPGS